MDLRSGAAVAVVLVGLAVAVGVTWSNSQLYEPDPFFDGLASAEVVSTNCARHQAVVFAYTYEGRQFTNEAASRTPCEALRIGQRMPVRFSKQNPARSEIVTPGEPGFHD